MTNDTTLRAVPEARVLAPALLKARDGRVILTPHAGEMAYLLGMDKTAVTADPQAVCLRCAETFGAVSVLKGPTTWIASAAAELYAYYEGPLGLTISGSDDTLVGMIASMAPRAVSPSQAAAWGVYLHGEAGNRLTQRFGLLRFLPRELRPILAAIEQGDLNIEGHGGSAARSAFGVGSRQAELFLGVVTCMLAVLPFSFERGSRESHTRRSHSGSVPKSTIAICYPQ